MASAIIALALEANTNLTWRDVQHIIVRTSRPLNLKAPDWMENAMGRFISHSYGYGLMDAGEMVSEAKKWNLVPRAEMCVVSSPYYEKMIPAMGYITVEIDVKDCPDIRHLEHVVVPTQVAAGRKRGDLRIYLQSPSGTRSTLLDARPQDYSTNGFMDWPFMSVHFWGENPTGTWTLEIHNDAFSKWASEAKFHKWQLELYGIPFDPNSGEYAEERFNVVREASLEENPDDVEGGHDMQDDEDHEEELAEDDVAIRGCVSKQIECTRDVTQCRTFSHRRVADIFCKCTPLCLEVASAGVKDGNQMFNMQCDYINPDRDEDEIIQQIEETKFPFYCQFIPFFSYGKA